jgi:alpha-beta hydrolase superfamily lysophospholipase
MGFEHAFTLVGSSGATLSTRRQTAEGGARGVFVLSHGLAEHALRYVPMARFLAQRGYDVYGYDHRGHGATTAPDAPLGRFAWRDGERRLLEDLETVRNLAEVDNPGLPVFLFGHSMGGTIAARAAQERPGAFAGLAVWNANLDPGIAGRLGLLLLKAERFFKGSDVPSRLGPSLTFDTWGRSIPDARTGFDWLSRDETEVRKYIDDPLCGFDCSVSLWIDLVAMTLAAGLDRNLRRLPKNLPINLVGGGRDPATDRGRAMSWLADRLRRLDITKVYLTIYPDMRHETLNEFGREQAMIMLADWADSVVSAQGK